MPSKGDQHLCQVDQVSDVRIDLDHPGKPFFERVFLNCPNDPRTNVDDAKESVEGLCYSIGLVVTHESHTANQQPSIGVVDAEHRHVVFNTKFAVDDLEADTISEANYVLKHSR